MTVNQQQDKHYRLLLFSMTLLGTTAMANIVLPVETEQVSFLNSQIPFPETRFRQYRGLSESERRKVSAAGYTPEEWDQPMTSIVETVPFSDLGILQYKVSELGLSPDQWDCYINHYAGYSWNQLDDNLKMHALVLGWQPDTWQGYADTGSEDVRPIIFREFWDELSDAHKKTAGEFCYFENTWNGENLRYWTTAPPSERTPAPSKAVPTDKEMSASSTPFLSIFLEVFLIIGMAIAFLVV